MTRNSSCNKELLPGREIVDAFRWRGGIRPRPSRKFVDKVVAGEQEFVRGDLPRRTEGGSVGYGGVGVAELVEGGVDDVHGWCMGFCTGEIDDTIQVGSLASKLISLERRVWRFYGSVI